MPFVLWLPWQRDEVITLITISNDCRKSHQIWRTTDKNLMSGEQIYGKGAQCAPLGLYRVKLV